MSPLLPMIIQGGMGVGISGWRLAHAVAAEGQLGVVAGTLLDVTLVRHLNDGDPGGHFRRALASFPIPAMAKRVLDTYFRPKGREGKPYSALELFKLKLTPLRTQVLVLASYANVFLAREGHTGRVGINLLTKIQVPTLETLYGAMLAGVDAVLMGAGIPREIPGALDRLAEHAPTTLRIDVEDALPEERHEHTFHPEELWDGDPAPVTRPLFLPIIASNSLATMMVRKATGRIDGFIVEGPTAGGHNAPPRGARQVNERGEPLYGTRDVVDLERLQGLGLPFWIAGGAGSPERLAEARAAGAEGIQVGTLFAYTDESGLRPDLKARVIQHALDDDADVYTDGRASPTGFPFKVVSLPESLSEEATYDERTRVCDLGYLRSAFRDPDGQIQFRCAAEPTHHYVRKHGRAEDAVGRKCLCNALTANIGLGQVRGRARIQEAPLLTSGDDLMRLRTFLDGRTRYTAKDVLDYLLSAPSQAPTPTL